LKKELTLLLIIAIVVPIAGYLLLPSSSASGPTLAIMKLYSTSLQTGRSVKMNVTVSDVSNLIGCRLNLAFDPSVLKVTSGDPHGCRDPLTGIRYDIYEGPFLESSGSSTTFLINGVNNKKGSISAIYDAVNSAGASSSGSGVVASINFSCLKATTNTTINITGTSTLETTATFGLAHQVIDGFITANGPPGVWTERWFQAALMVIAIEIMIVVLGILVTMRWWRSRGQEERKESEEVEDLFR
jgi:hypothetical protein